MLSLPIALQHEGSDFAVEPFWRLKVQEVAIVIKGDVAAIGHSVANVCNAINVVALCAAPYEIQARHTQCRQQVPHVEKSI